MTRDGGRTHTNKMVFLTLSRRFLPGDSQTHVGRRARQTGYVKVSSTSPMWGSRTPPQQVYLSYAEVPHSPTINANLST